MDEEDILEYLKKSPITGGIIDAASENLAAGVRNRDTTDQVYQRNLQKVREMSFPRQVYEAGKHEFGKLGTGLADMADTAVGMFGTDSMSDTAIARQHERAAREAAADQEYQAFKDNAGFAAKAIGGMVPYVISGRFAGPSFVSKASKVLDTADKSVRATARATGTASKSVIEKMAEMGGPVGAVGEKMQKEFVQPISEIAARKAKQIKPRNPLYEGTASRILGDTALGAVEGAVHYDNSVLDGAAASGLGSIGGQMLKPYLHRMPSYYNKTEQDLVDWGIKQGWQPLPGLKHGHRGSQMFENDLRSAKDWADLIYQNDKNNSYIMNRIAFEQLGVPEKQMMEMGPQELKAHMNNLSSEYKDLTSKTVGWLRPSEIDQAKNEVGLRFSELPKRHQKLVEDFKTKFENLTNSGLPIRDPITGRMKAYTFSGDDYQNFRSSIKDEIDAAYTRGDKSVVKALTPMFKFLDQGIENGLRSKGGDANVSAWKDLNERYAISKLLINHGMNDMGMVDPRKLGGYLMSHDAERMLTEGAGPRMNNLYKMSKLQTMINKQASGGLFSGSEDPNLIHNPGKKTVTQRILQTPAGALPGLRPMYAAMYRKGWPSSYGLLGLNGKGMYDAPLYTRAFQQSTQLYPQLEDMVERGYDYVKSIPGKIGARINGPAEEDLNEFIKSYKAQ